MHYFDRYDLSFTHRVGDWHDNAYGQPTHYLVHPGIAGGVPMNVHRSRILRFDGLPALRKSGYTAYDQDFGVSTLVPIIVSLMEDQTLATAVAHASQEFSIPVLHIAGLREAIAGGGAEDEASPDQIGRDINTAKSLFRLLMQDEPGREEFTRVAVNFGGIADLFDKYEARGSGSARDSADAVPGQPAHRHIGIKGDPPEYKWLSLLELSDKEIADAAKSKAEALKLVNDGQWIDEDEAREALNGDQVHSQFGSFPGCPVPGGGDSHWNMRFCSPHGSGARAHLPHRSTDTPQPQVAVAALGSTARSVWPIPFLRSAAGYIRCF